MKNKKWKSRFQNELGKEIQLLLWTQAKLLFLWENNSKKFNNLIFLFSFEELREYWEKQETLCC